MRANDLGAVITPPLESVNGSAHFGMGSPPVSLRAQHNLPSPASVAHPLSAAPTVVPQAPQSVGSPATSYQPTVSIHSASTSTATSAHIADLQHQVTLKSLSLSTLQSEYSSLLQKLQRERVKSQAIEKKTSVADQEVNDLTGRNEELADQVKSLELQLESCEKKRDNERTEAAREKEQWSRMLELGGRIQTKHAEEKQKLKNENQSLVQRVAGYEVQPHRSGSPYSYSALQTAPGGSNADRTSGRFQQQQSRPSDVHYIGNDIAPTGDIAGLVRENEILHSRIENLRFALEEARRHHQMLNERTREVLARSEEIGGVVRRALDDMDDRRSVGLPPPSLESHNLADAQQTQQSPHGNANASQPSRVLSLPSSAADSRKVSQDTDTTTATLASIARAHSPGPAELGFHVTPSTSSPEDIIKALGPVSAPYPAYQSGTLLPFPVPKPAKKQSTARQSKPARRQSTDAVTSWLMPRIAEQHDSRDNFHIGSFRPLSQQIFHPDSDTTRPAEHGRKSPHSHHSSPGPVRKDRSPSSSSSGEGKVELASPSAMDQREGSGLAKPRLVEQRAEAMPPPPRPAMISEPFTALPNAATRVDRYP